MRGRIRIKAEMSEYFRKEIAEPGIFLEYEHGFEEMIMLNKAFALMLEEQKLISRDERRQIMAGLQKVREHFSAADVDGKYEELYFNMEQMLMKEIGVAVGGKLHTGRSRNDIYATLWRMEMRKSVWLILRSVIGLQKELLRLAKTYKDMVVTGYTHMQPAQPITLGYYYMAAFEVLNRDFARLQDAYARLNQSPYGAAALAGTGFPIERGRLKDLLGFDGIVVNNLDCVGAKDYVLEVESALSIMMVNISRIVQDHYIWCTSEFGILQVGGEVAVCSSIMPQKKNPVTLELAKAKGAHIIGALVSSLSVLKNTPFSLCMDLFEAHAQYWQGLKASLNSVDLLAETLRYASFDKELAYRRAKENFSTVTALADFLTERFQISFSQAHDIVGDMVGNVLNRREGIDQMTPALLESSSKAVLGRTLIASAQELQAVLEPLSNVRSKTSLGSPGEEALRAMLQDSAAALASEEKWLDERVRRVEVAYEKILLMEMQE